jgi:hypothetical protein
MDVTFHIADSTLESVALEALRAGRITEVQLRQMLGLARIELDGFLTAYGNLSGVHPRRF